MNRNLDKKRKASDIKFNNVNEGVHLTGMINGLRVNFTVDSGAGRIVISEKTLNRLSENRKPLLKKSIELCNCSGEPLREIGKVNFDIEIGSFTFMRDIIVAGVADERFLGMDMLMEGGKPADVPLSRGVILFRGEEIPCKTRISRSIRRVVAADNEVIPPYSEKLIDVFRTMRPVLKKTFLLVQLLLFLEDYPLYMAKCLLDVKDKVTSKLRVLNPYRRKLLSGKTLI